MSLVRLSALLTVLSMVFVGIACAPADNGPIRTVCSDIASFCDCATYAGNTGQSGYTTISSCDRSYAPGAACCLHPDTDPSSPPIFFCSCNVSACVGNETAVTDCAAASAAAQAGDPLPLAGDAGTGGTCNSGPGTCTFPGGSADHCRNGAVCARSCPSCDYSCYVMCSSDADCAGFCSGGSAPTPLTCGNLSTGAQLFRYCEL